MHTRIRQVQPCQEMYLWPCRGLFERWGEEFEEWNGFVPIIRSFLRYMQVSGGCSTTSATQTLHGQAETCRNMGSYIMTRWNFWKNCPTSLFKTVFHISQGQPWEIHSVCYLKSSKNGYFFTNILFLSGRVAGHGTICCRNPLTIRVSCHDTLAVHHKKLILSRSIRTYWKKMIMQTTGSLSLDIELIKHQRKRHHSTLGNLLALRIRLMFEYSKGFSNFGLLEYQAAHSK